MPGRFPIASLAPLLCWLFLLVPSALSFGVVAPVSQHTMLISSCARRTPSSRTWAALTRASSFSIRQSSSRKPWRSLAAHANSHDSLPPTAPLPTFTKGQAIQVEVLSFGPLGASVDVIALDHASDNVLPEGAVPHATGLILQREIAYFRTARRNVDVVLGEVLPAYVEGVREEENDDSVDELSDNTMPTLPKLDISLRVVGGKAKTEEWSVVVWDRLQEAPDGQVAVGDKSSPAEIAALFPGASKGAFKKAVARLYKEGKVEPGPYVTKLMS